MNEPQPTVYETTEVERLRAQHALIKRAFGRLILCPLDTSCHSLRILDSATADGFWLYDVRSELSHPDSAKLVGTDIVSSTAAFSMPANIHLAHQNILHEWPSDWQDSFDLVHQRLVISAAITFDEAVKAVQRLVGLLKPGTGWLQLVEYVMPSGPVQASDSPLDTILKGVGNAVIARGWDITINAKLPQLLDAAGGLSEIGCSEATAILGKGCPDDLLQDSFTEINGLGMAFLRKMDKSRSHEELQLLTQAALDHAVHKGYEMTWRAIWARRV